MKFLTLAPTKRDMAVRLLMLVLLCLTVGTLLSVIRSRSGLSAMPRPPAAIIKLKASSLTGLGKFQVSTRGSQGQPAGRKTANEVAGGLDGVADNVYGQLDFVTGAAPAVTDATTLHQAADVFVFDLTLQIFVVDTANNRVLGWKSTADYTRGDPANLVLGQQDYTATDAPNPPTAATMNAPTGVAMGEDGVLYVSDTGNNRVLVFIPYNICEYYEVIDDVYCLAGHQFSEYYTPIFLDGMDADYALGQPDLNSNTLRPTGPTSLNQPMGLAVDFDDNLVVADHGNNRVVVYEWPLEDGKSVSWIIGQDATRINATSAKAAPNPPTQWSLNGPTSVAIGPAAKQLYIADTGNNRIIVHNVSPVDYLADFVIGQPDFVSNTPNNGGLSATSLNHPTGIKVDAGNQLYVADTDNHRVLAFDRSQPDGIADMVIGQPDFTSNTPNNGGISAQSLNSPRGIGTDAISMALYVTDQGNNRILHYFQPLPNPLPLIAELDPGTVEAGTAGFTLNIWGSGFLVDDSVVAVNGVTRTVGSDYLGLMRIPISATDVLTTGQVTITVHNPPPGGGTSLPTALTIYQPQAADDLADNVLGQRGFTTNDGAFAPVQADTLFGPAGVVIDQSSGRLFIADMDNARVLSWPSSTAYTNGGSADLVFGKPDLKSYFYDAPPGLNLIKPAALALDSQGNLYVSDAQDNYVAAYRQPFISGMAADLVFGWVDNPLALLLDHADNLYVADTFQHRVFFYEKPLAGGDTIPDKIFGQVDLNTIEPNAGGAIGANTLHYPSGLAMDRAGNLYVADSNNHRVLVFFDPLNSDTTADLLFGQQGDFSTGMQNKGGVSAMSLNYPMGLTIDSKGALYVADSDNHRVLRFDDPLHTDQVADLVYGQGGSFTQNQPNHGQLSRQGSSKRDRMGLDQPTGVGLTAAGDLFITDYGNNRVLGIWEGGSAPAATPTSTPVTTPTVTPPPTATATVNPEATATPSATPTALPTITPSATPDLTEEEPAQLYLPLVTK